MATTSATPEQAHDPYLVRHKSGKLERSEMMWGLIFLSPWIIGMLVFILIPMIATLVFSFTDFSLQTVGNVSYVGLSNYQKFFDDPVVKQSLGVTFKFFAMALPFSIIIPLGVAALMNAERLWGKRGFRTFFYMPFMVPLVSTVLAWGGFLNAQTGWLNKFLESIGIPGPDWLQSTTWIYPALLLVGLWTIGNAVLVLLAAMQGVPTDMYEAARVDGANPLRIYFSITLPMITPIIFYNLVLAVVGLMQYFLEPFVLTRGQGDPGGSTMFYNLYLYKVFFKFQDMAYGATLAWILFIIILVMTGLIFWSQRFWVYQAED